MVTVTFRMLLMCDIVCVGGLRHDVIRTACVLSVRGPCLRQRGKRYRLKDCGLRSKGGCWCISRNAWGVLGDPDLVQAAQNSTLVDTCPITRSAVRCDASPATLSVQAKCLMKWVANMSVLVITALTL